MLSISNVCDFKRRQSLESQSKSQWLPGQISQRTILDQEEKEPQP